ncbi:hypothetical protein Tsp_14249, partial [Trichinella spiralis]|uniref:hypothetical protein n=1 Tax=Trichinella spiralis TaxID=6334 RepID=UPI0001EFE807
SRAKRFPPPPAAGNSSTLACYEVWPAMKIYGSWLDILSGAWMEHLKLFLNGTIRCSAFISVRGCPSAANCDLRFRNCPYPAVQASFPGVQMQGCYFHFCQAVLRKVAELGLRTRYLHEAETKKNQPLSNVSCPIDVADSAPYQSKRFPPPPQLRKYSVPHFGRRGYAALQIYVCKNVGRPRRSSGVTPPKM